MRLLLKFMMMFDVVVFLNAICKVVMIYDDI